MLGWGAALCGVAAAEFAAAATVSRDTQRALCTGVATLNCAFVFATKVMRRGDVRLRQPWVWTMPAVEAIVLVAIAQPD